MAEYNLAGGVTVEHPSGLFARGSILRGVFADLKSPIAYGYDGQDLPVYFNQDPVLNVTPAGLAGGFGGGRGGINAPEGAALPPTPKLIDYAKAAQSKPGELAANRAKLGDQLFELAERDGKGEGKDQNLYIDAYKEAGKQKKTYDEARLALARRRTEEVQAGKLGVDLSIQSNNLRNQSQLTAVALKRAHAPDECLSNCQVHAISLLPRR